MLQSADSNSAIFRRLTNRESPKLVHPTAAAFDPQEWLSALSDVLELTNRDVALCQAATVVGNNLKTLRHHYISTFFGDLSPKQAAVYAIADASRAWALVARKSIEH